MNDDFRAIVDTGRPRRVLAFPHAGGAASVFRRWAPALASHADLTAVQLPGREDRYRDLPDASLPACADRIAGALARSGDPRPLTLFGHSFGGLLAFEVARRLERAGLAPERLVASAVRAPRSRRGGRLDSTHSDDALLDAVTAATPAMSAALAHREFAALFLDTLRADLRLHELYRYEPGPPLRSPVTVLSAPDDPLLSPAEVEAWALEAVSPVTFKSFDGGHFFCFDDLFPVADALFGIG